MYIWTKYVVRIMNLFHPDHVCGRGLHNSSIVEWLWSQADMDSDTLCHLSSHFPHTNSLL